MTGWRRRWKKRVKMNDFERKAVKLYIFLTIWLQKLHYCTKNIFACLFSVHNIGLSRHEQNMFNETTF